MFLLNTPVLPNPGVYDYTEVDLQVAKDLVLQGGWESAIGHPATAEMLSQLFGVEIPVRRIAIRMEPGDEAIVFRPDLSQWGGRLPEGYVLSAQEVRSIRWQIGLLKRIA